MEDRYWIAVAAETGSGRLPRRWMGAAAASPAVAARRMEDEDTMVVFDLGEVLKGRVVRDEMGGLSRGSRGVYMMVE